MQKVNHIVKVSASRQTYKDYEKSNLNSHGVDVIQNLKNGPNQASFSFLFVFSNAQYNFYNQYMVPGFKLMTFGT